MLYVLHCLDRKNGAALREANREDHAAYMRKHADHVVLGGPLLAADGQTRIGVLAVVRFSTRAQLETFAAEEPYRQAGLFSSVRMTPFQTVMQNPQPSAPGVSTC